MPLHKLIEYKIISNDALYNIVQANESDPTNITVITEQIKHVANVYEGEAVAIIPNTVVPVWYYFVLFYELYQHSPEVVLQIAPEQFVVLHTVYTNNEYARSEKVVNYPQLYTTAESTEEQLVEYTVDLSQAPVLFANTDMAEGVQMPTYRTKQLTFTGQQSHVNDILTFRLWFSYAKAIQYMYQNQLIRIV